MLEALVGLEVVPSGRLLMVLDARLGVDAEGALDVGPSIIEFDHDLFDAEGNGGTATALITPNGLP